MRISRHLVGLLGLALVSACSRDARITLPPPPTTLPPTSTSAPVDHSNDQLPAVAGKTTTTIAIQPGPATLTGMVVGPDGPVPGATVQLERLVGDGVGVALLPTTAEGSWTAPNVLGGRYRIRAWRSPDLALTKPVIWFLEGSQTKDVQLKVDRYAGLHVGAAIAPEPPTVGEQASLVVLVTTRSVDDRGVVRATPVVNARVELFGGGRWQLDSSNVSATDGSGQARWLLRCREAGEQPLSVLVGNEESFPLSLPPCAEAAVDPTTSSTSTTRSTPRSSTSTTEPD